MSFFRTIEVPVVPGLVTACLIIAATIYAVEDGKVANLLIGAAMVSTLSLVFGVMFDRRIGDAYDSGRNRERRAIARDVADLVETDH